MSPIEGWARVRVRQETFVSQRKLLWLSQRSTALPPDQFHPDIYLTKFLPLILLAIALVCESAAGDICLSEKTTLAQSEKYCTAPRLISS